MILSKAEAIQTSLLVLLSNLAQDESLRQYFFRENFLRDMGKLMANKELTLTVDNLFETPFRFLNVQEKFFAVLLK